MSAIEGQDRLVDLVGGTPPVLHADRSKNTISVIIIPTFRSSLLSKSSRYLCRSNWKGRVYLEFHMKLGGSIQLFWSPAL